MSEKSNAVATKNDLRSMINSDAYRKQWAMVLPRHLTPERMTRVALTAITKTPKLMQCSKESVMSCLLDCASMGIEPDGRRAHLIPYGDKCTLIIDYKGLAELAMRSGLVSSINADTICENDEYEENLGRVLIHRINRREPRGEMYAAYSHVVMKDGNESFEIMSKHEIDGIRKRSKSSGSGPWVTDYGEMAKKTVFRRHSKWLPLSPEFRDALDKSDDMPIDVNNRVSVSKPIMDVPNVKDGKALDRPDNEPKPSKKTPPRKQNPKSQAEAQDDGNTSSGGPLSAPTAKERKGLDTPQ